MRKIGEKYPVCEKPRKPLNSFGNVGGKTQVKQSKQPFCLIGQETLCPTE